MGGSVSGAASSGLTAGAAGATAEAIRGAAGADLSGCPQLIQMPSPSAWAIPQWGHCSGIKSHSQRLGPFSRHPFAAGGLGSSFAALTPRFHAAIMRQIVWTKAVSAAQSCPSRAALPRQQRLRRDFPTSCLYQALVDFRQGLCNTITTFAKGEWQDTSDGCKAGRFFCCRIGLAVHFITSPQPHLRTNFVSASCRNRHRSRAGATVPPAIFRLLSLP